jgi:tetratricopeptide (TPR) repeat protein
VIARNSVARYKGKQNDTQTIGRELNVRAVLVGRMIQRGDELSITIELIDVRDNKHLWGWQYDRKLADIIAMQSTIALDVSEKLRLRLTGEEKQRLARHYTEDGEAYRLYLMGRHYQRWGRKEALEKSVAYLEQAIKRDANYAPAYTEMGEAYRNLGYGGWIAPRESLHREESAALKALRLDDTFAEAHVLAADIRALNLDWSGADDEYKRAIELDPNSVRVQYAYALHLNRLGRFDEAMQHLKRAQEVDPASFEVNEGIGLVFYASRQYDRAIAQYQKIIELDPNFAHGLLAEAYQAKGMYQEAVGELEKAGEKGNAQLGYAYAVAGKTAEARRVLNELQELSRERYVGPFRFALVYIGLGDKDQSFVWLDKTFDEDPYRLAVLKMNPSFDGLRSDPRFTDLLRRMKLA